MEKKILNLINQIRDINHIDQFENYKSSILIELESISNELNGLKENKAITLKDTNKNQTIAKSINSPNPHLEADLTTKGYYLNAIIDNLPGHLWLKDLDSNFLIVNKECASAAGYKNSNDLIGKSDFDIKSKSVAELYRQTELDIINTGQAVVFEESYINGDNQKKWKKTYKAPVFDESDNIIGTTGYSRDITNRKNSEWQITKLSQAVEQSSASIVITDLQGNIEYVNHKFTTVTGYTYEESIGKNPRILKSDKFNSDTYKELWNTITSGNEWHGEFQNVKKNGEIYWELATISAIRNTDGEISSFLAVKEDITERKKIEIEIIESEEKFRQITENIGEVFWLRNAKNTEMLYVNQAFENVWGRTCNSVYEQPELFIDSIFDKDKQKIMLKLEEYTKSEIFNEEFRIVKPNGELRWIQVKSSPIRSHDNEIIRHTGIAIDITNLKNTEATLRKNKEKYRLITENSSDVIWVYNLNQNKYSYVSPAIFALRGFTVAEALNEKFNDSFTTESMGIANKLIKQNINLFFEGEKNTIYSIDEVQQVHKNGETVWVEISSRLRYNEQEESELIGVSRNIDKRKKIEFENNKNELKYKLLFENSPLGIFISNAEGQIIEGNKMLLSILGSPSLEETKKINCLTYKPLIDNGYSEAFKRCIETNETIILELPYRTNWGLDIYISGYLIPLQTNQTKVEMVYTLFEDITLRKRAEDELIGMTEIQDIIMKMASRYINIKNTEIETSINQTLGELCKFIDADRAIIYEYDCEKSECNNIYEWCSEGIDRHITELQNIPFAELQEHVDAHSNGETFEVEDINLFQGRSKKILEKIGIKSSITLPIMNQGHCTGFVGFDSILKKHKYTQKEKSLLFVFGQMLSNLQQRMSLESKLITEKENAQKSNNAKSEFLANMSHELRTPLNGVIGFSELLVGTTMNEVQKQYAKAINVSAKNLFGVINDILDFSKFEANKLDLELVKVDILELLESSIDIIKHAAEKKGLEILLNISNDLPRYAIIDQLRITQVVTNLLGNAIKFTTFGEIELKVDYKPLNNNKGTLTFSIIDTGIGISKSQKSVLFKAFSQADSSTTRKFGGTGLGLIISDMIISKMGGKIYFESEVNVGSRFYFSIETETEAENNDLKAISEKKLEFLIIDDNEKSSQILSNKLAGWDINSTICNSGIEAIKLIEKEKKFNLILVDYSMPHLDGIDTISLISKKMQESNHNIPFILMHGATENFEFYDKCDSLNIDRRITKPVKTKDINKLLISIFSENIIEVEIEDKILEITNDIDNLNQRKMKILVADDDMFNMILAKAMIKNIMPDVELIEACNGKEAVEKTIEFKPDLIFMDVQMPEMDGNDATKAIRNYENNNCTRTPIIGLTAGALKEEKDKCLMSGMDDFLTKPIDSSKLESTINLHLMQIN